MPPLLCLSPILLDHSFPRDNEVLQLVSIALGQLQGCLDERRGQLVLSDTIREFVASIDWSSPCRFALLREIHRYLNELVLRPDERVVSLDLTSVRGYGPHPVPEGCQGQGLVEVWADEMGRLLMVHDGVCTAGEYFIGVTCANAFAGGDRGKYACDANRRAFPLVGPDDICSLGDSYEWDVPPDIHRRDVSFNDARKNIRAIGGIIARQTAGTSHYKVLFKGARSWTLDRNTDPVPERFLRELTAITGYPPLVVRAALIFGEPPKSRLRLPTEVLAVAPTG